MKKKGALLEYHQERTNDLMRKYDEYIANCKHICLPELYEAVINMPAERFWVSDTRAAAVIFDILKGKDVLSGMHQGKREMYIEIYNRVLELKKEMPNANIITLCEIVVSQPAPKFYISAITARLLISKAIKQWNQKKRQRLQALLLRQQ